MHIPADVAPNRKLANLVLDLLPPTERTTVLLGSIEGQSVVLLHHLEEADGIRGGLPVGGPVDGLLAGEELGGARVRVDEGQGVQFEVEGGVEG